MKTELNIKIEAEFTPLKEADFFNFMRERKGGGDWTGWAKAQWQLTLEHQEMLLASEDSLKEFIKKLVKTHLGQDSSDYPEAEAEDFSVEKLYAAERLDELKDRVALKFFLDEELMRLPGIG